MNTSTKTYTLEDLLGGPTVEPIHVRRIGDQKSYCGLPMNGPGYPLGSLPGPRCGRCARVREQLARVTWGPR